MEHEMRIEIRKIESELAALDKELEKLNMKIAQLTALRAKKERDAKILKSNFGEYTTDVKDPQMSLLRMLQS